MLRLQWKLHGYSIRFPRHIENFNSSVMNYNLFPRGFPTCIKEKKKRRKNVTWNFGKKSGV